MSKKSEKNGVKLLPISIIIFIILAVAASYIILNKGKIAGYSLVQINESAESEEEELEEEENVLEISAEKKYLSSKERETAELTVTLNGEEMDINEVELTSSNEEVLKISKGSAVAVSDGKATVTAKKDDVEAQADFRVITPIKSMTFTTTNSIVRIGKSLQMKLVAQPSDASVETLKYTSSDESIATVNQNGIVTGVATGKVTITVTDSYTGLEKSVDLTIRN